MESTKLSFTLRQVTNGWILEVDRDMSAEFIFSRHNQALSMMRKILNGDLDPFEDQASDDEGDDE